MVNLADMRQAARVVKDEHGDSVVQVPLNVWEAVIGKIENQPTSQLEQILSLAKQWEGESEEDMPDEWWNDFQKFLQDNRVNFPDRQLDFGDK